MVVGLTCWETCCSYGYLATISRTGLVIPAISFFISFVESLPHLLMCLYQGHHQKYQASVHLALYPEYWVHTCYSFPPVEFVYGWAGELARCRHTLHLASG